MIKQEEILKIASLSKLEVSSQEIEKLSQELNQIIEFVEKLNSLDTENIEATSHAVDMNNVFRPDQVLEFKSFDKVLEQAPGSEGRFFTVPKVL